VRPTIGDVDAAVLLDIELSAIMHREKFTRDPGPVIAALRERAGAATEQLNRSVGAWVGFYDTDDTRALCVGLLEAFPGARRYVSVGAEARFRRVHGTG